MATEAPAGTAVEARVGRSETGEEQTLLPGHATANARAQPGLVWDDDLESPGYGNARSEAAAMNGCCGECEESASRHGCLHNASHHRPSRRLATHRNAARTTRSNVTAMRTAPALEDTEPAVMRRRNEVSFDDGLFSPVERYEYAFADGESWG